MIKRFSSGGDLSRSLRKKRPTGKALSGRVGTYSGETSLLIWLARLFASAVHKIPRALIAQAAAAFLIPIAAAQRPDANAPVRLEQYKSPIRVACIGDSLTTGSKTKFPVLDAYPAQLQRMLDYNIWSVQGFGVNGTTLMNSGDKPYQKEEAFQDALKFNPDVVVIMLGTNDSKPPNWKFKKSFTADYRDLIRKFKTLSSKPRILICRPVVVFGTGNYEINEAAVQEEMPLIAAIAEQEQTGLIDQHSVLEGKEDLSPDRVHPNTEGANLLARNVYHVLTGKEFSGTLEPILHTHWNGYSRIDFACRGRAAFVVEPKHPAPGKPWIWRPEIADAAPELRIALLEKGWHAAFVNVQDMYGSPLALDTMDIFYARVLKDYALSPTVALAGFSRGGLGAFNWAARHPERVASIYADAPVLDFKSWPGGKGKGIGSPMAWERCLKAYGLTEQEAMDYRLNPLDNLKPLADAKIPILSVCGGADKTAPFEENTQVLEKRYHELGGDVEVIFKPAGDHFSHSLPDPKPIIDFFLKHAPLAR